MTDKTARPRGAHWTRALLLTGGLLVVGGSYGIFYSLAYDTARFRLEDGDNVVDLPPLLILGRGCVEVGAALMLLVLLGGLTSRIMLIKSRKWRWSAGVALALAVGFAVLGDGVLMACQLGPVFTQEQDKASLLVAALRMQLGWTEIEALGRSQKKWLMCSTAGFDSMMARKGWKSLDCNEVFCRYTRRGQGGRPDEELTATVPAYQQRPPRYFIVSVDKVP